MSSVRFLFVLAFALLAGPLMAADYDVVILSGRVMDPETSLDGIANVGIRDGVILTITQDDISGSETIDASGHVVAPGFIDYHWHGLDPLTSKLALRDGVTTAMDLEAGALNVDQWYEAHDGKMLYNYGTSANHLLARMLVHDAQEMKAQDGVDLEGPMDVRQTLPLWNVAAEDGVPGWSVSRSNLAQTNRIMKTLDEELRQGALGLGSLIGYMRKLWGQSQGSE